MLLELLLQLILEVALELAFEFGTAIGWNAIEQSISVRQALGRPRTRANGAVHGSRPVSCSRWEWLSYDSRISKSTEAHHRVMFPHLDRLESMCVVHGPRAPEMACVAVHI